MQTTDYQRNKSQRKKKTKGKKRPSAPQEFGGTGGKTRGARQGEQRETAGMDWGEGGRGNETRGQRATAQQSRRAANTQARKAIGTRNPSRRESPGHPWGPRERPRRKAKKKRGSSPGIRGRLRMMKGSEYLARAVYGCGLV